MGKKNKSSAPSWQAAIDQRASQGLTVGDQFFNAIGGSAADRSAAISYANSKGYSLGNAWADVAKPVYNSAGDQVYRSPTVQPNGQLVNQIMSSPTTKNNVNYQWVPGLLRPGQAGYDPASGGGAWVYAQGPIDPAGLRAFYANGVSPDVAFDGTGLDRNNYTFQGMYGGTQSNQVFQIPNNGQAFNYDQWVAQQQAQQQATMQSIDAMNAEFLRQQEALMAQQEQRLNASRTSINVGSSSPDAAQVKRKKSKAKSVAKAGSTTNGLGISSASGSGVAGSGLSIGGA